MAFNFPSRSIPALCFSCMLLACMLFSLSTIAVAQTTFRIGLDPGAPISGSSIIFRGDLIQSSGSYWVRINFILGPWSSPTDSTRMGPQNLTWFETYDLIINDAVNRGLKVYALIGAEAVKSTHPVNSDGYVAAYVNNFRTIVNRYKDRIQVYESFNEPNDWAGGTSAQVTPYYFAKMLEDIYRAVKINDGHWNDPAWRNLILVTGPLFSHDQDTGGPYFTQVWQAGRNQLGWNALRSTYGTYPFDGIGYHLYVAQGTSDPTTVRNAINANMNAMWNSVTALEGTGTTKKLWISEIGWNTAGISEQIQAANVDTSINLFRADSRVIMVSWFCLRDFGDLNKWGVERADGSKKPAWARFVAQAAIDAGAPTATPSNTRTNTPLATVTPTNTPPATATPTNTPTFPPILNKATIDSY